jgi:hypothetical protein
LLDLVDVVFRGTIENKRTDVITSQVRLTFLHEVSGSSTCMTVI